MRRILFLIFLILIISVFSFMLAGCGVLESLGLREGPDDELRPVSSIVIGEAEASKLTSKTPLRLYFANADNTKLKLEIRYVELKENKKDAASLASTIINELIKGPTDGTAYKRTIPAEARLRSPVSINGKVATVDMSKEFKTKHPGGKDAEKMTIYSIVNSLTELEEIEKVKFTIEGKVQKEYMGNFRFDRLFPRSAQLISKETGDASVITGLDEIDTAGEENADAASGSDPASGVTKETAGQDDETLDGLDLLE